MDINASPLRLAFFVVSGLRPFRALLINVPTAQGPFRFLSLPPLSRWDNDQKMRKT